MALLTYSATPAKGSTVTVTLDKAELLALNAVGIDSFWTGGSDGDVVQAIVTLKTFPGNGKITLTFDLSQATPTAPLTLPQYARDVFQISKIVVVDTMGDKIAIPRATLLTEIPTLSESEVNLSGNMSPPTIGAFDPVFVPEIPRHRFDITALSDDVAGDVSITIYQLTQLPVDLAEVEADGTVIASQSGIAVSTSPINISINGPTLASVPESPTMYYYAVVAQDSGANKEYIAIEWEFIPPARTILVLSDYNSSGVLTGTEYYANDTHKGTVTSANGLAISTAFLSPDKIKSVHSNSQLKTISLTGPISVTSEIVPNMSSVKCIDTHAEGAYNIIVGGTSSVTGQGAISVYDPATPGWTAVTIGGNSIESLSVASGTGQVFGIVSTFDEFTVADELALYDPGLNDVNYLTTAWSGTPYHPETGEGTSGIKTKVIAADDGSLVICLGREAYATQYGTDIIPFVSVIRSINAWTPAYANITLPSGYSIIAPGFVDGYGDLPFRDAIIEGTTAYIVGSVVEESTNYIQAAMFVMNLASSGLDTTVTVLNRPAATLGDPIGLATSIVRHNGAIYITGWIMDTGEGKLKAAVWVDGVYSDKSTLTALESGGSSRGVFIGTTG